jgi:hypothetical protein
MAPVVVNLQPGGQRRTRALPQTQSPARAMVAVVMLEQTVVLLEQAVVMLEQAVVMLEQAVVMLEQAVMMQVDALNGLSVAWEMPIC